MDSDFTDRRRPGILISVKNLAEARLVAQAGVDIVDIKDPEVGALGRADETTLRDIAVYLKELSQPGSLALGELGDFERDPPTIDLLNNFHWAKIGLAGSADSDWRSRIGRIWKEIGVACLPVAVCYADWRRARSPRPQTVIAFAAENGLTHVLIDTFDKSSGASPEVLGESGLEELIEQARTRGLSTVLAGSLGLAHTGLIRQLAPDLVGVRGAVCSGNRRGAIDPGRLHEFVAGMKNASAFNPAS